jgi:hypothetical protein
LRWKQKNEVIIRTVDVDHSACNGISLQGLVIAIDFTTRCGQDSRSTPPIRKIELKKES